jgi:hypothetical protein
MMIRTPIRPPTAALLLLLCLAGTLRGQAHPAPQETSVTHHATGEFDVKMVPAATDEPTVGRLTLDKQYRGDLAATGRGEMLAVRTAVEGSAGYVAMERVAGTLAGRSGSFALQHSGTMDRGAPSLTITVVPDSGTEGLAGLAGTMRIRIEGGKHFYDFDYTLPAAP